MNEYMKINERPRKNQHDENGASKAKNIETGAHACIFV